MFYDELINLYTSLKIPPRYDEISKMDTAIMWYLADSEKNIVNVEEGGGRYIVEFDITSAFPTICRALFDPRSDFIQQMEKISEKKGKNIYIATTLKDSKDNHLRQLNVISKIIVVGILFDTINEVERESIFLLEIKKDSCIVSCTANTIERLDNLETMGGPYSQFLLKWNFKFHNQKYRKYVRANKTSLFITDRDLFIRKGIFKYCPKELEETVNIILSGGHFDKEKILKIYSSKFWNIIQMNNLTDLLDQYYICSNNKIVDFSGKYQKYNIKAQIDPRLYIKLFVYPALLSTKMEI